MDIVFEKVSYLHASKAFRRGAEEADWEVYCEPRGAGKVESR